MTILLYIIVYVVGYFASVVAMHKYHKQLGMDYNVPKTYVNHDDWDNNAQAFAGISVAWFLFWGMTLFMYLAKKIVKFSSSIEKAVNKPNDWEEQINELKKGNEVLSQKLEEMRKENSNLLTKLAGDVLEVDKFKRENADLKDSAFKRTQWLDKAKREAGYDPSVSFDDVWKEVLTFYKENKK